METKIGTINSVEKKETDEWTRYQFNMEDGGKYSTFDGKIGEQFKRGDVVEMTGETKGKYWNMNSMKLTDKKPEVVKIQGKQEYHLSPEEVRCRAIEMVINRYNREKVLISPENILIEAGIFENWITRE